MEDRRISKARIRANQKYNAKTYDVLTIRAKKELSIVELINRAWPGRAASKNEYMLNAIAEQLKRDGFEVDCSAGDQEE